MIIMTQGRAAIWNFDDLSRLHITGNGTGIQAVARNGGGGEVARYRNREQCIYVMEMFLASVAAEDRAFIFPAEKELEFAKQHGSSGGGKRHGGS